MMEEVYEEDYNTCDYCRRSYYEYDTGYAEYHCDLVDFECMGRGGETTVFEDTVSEIVINENNELTIFTRNTNVAGMLGEYIFLTKAEAIQALNRRGE